MITWDELDMEMRHHPLLWAQKLHICNIIPSLPLVLGPDLDLSDPKGLLTQFLPSVSKLPLQPFPMEQYCSVYHFMAVHLVQILQGFLSWPYRQEHPKPCCSICLCVDIYAWSTLIPKSASLQPFPLQLTLDTQCALGSGLSERCCTDFRSFGYSPFFLEYELVLDNIFIMNDDHDVEDSESDDKDEDQNEGEEGKEGEGH